MRNSEKIKPQRGIASREPRFARQGSSGHERYPTEEEKHIGPSEEGSARKDKRKQQPAARFNFLEDLENLNFGQEEQTPRSSLSGNAT